jgi:hypothetical protein
VSELGSWAADPGTALADGWEPGADDTLLRTYVDGFADMCADLAELVGGRVERDETIVLADAGSPAPYLNGAVVLRPLATDEVDGVVRRAVRFFAAGAGVGLVNFSALPIPRLAHLGLAPLGHPRFLLRSVGARLRVRPAVL